jgi:hypothetical protein
LVLAIGAAVLVVAGPPTAGAESEALVPAPRVPLAEPVASPLPDLRAAPLTALPDGPAASAPLGGPGAGIAVPGAPVPGAGPGGAPAVDPAGTAGVPSAGPAPVLALPGPIPTAGRGTFRYAGETGPVLGRSGRLLRYRVGVEQGSGEQVAEFAAAVHTALAGPGSWIDGGRLRLRQVPGTAPHDFTVHLATARTAARMCAAGGVDIRVGGRPYTSCRAPGRVILNLDRWRSSVPHYRRAGAPLSGYRNYLVNHEVGHELGYRHERCPGPGRRAPVMMQQTLFLDGCRPFSWPYLEGRRYAGPRK